MAITIDARGPRERLGSPLKEPPGAAERVRAFNLARRHTLVVKVLRIAFPVAAICCLGFYALTLGVSWKLGSGRFNPGEVKLTADDMTMKNPSYFGVNKDGGRYEVRAKKAVVAFNKDAPVKLIDVDGDLVQVNGVVTKLKAKYGTLDNAKSELELYDGIEIEGSNGLKARLSRAMIYSKQHLVVSKHPVEVEMPSGTVMGDTMTMRNDTRETTFVGNVRTHLVPASQAGQPAATPAFGRDQRQPVDVDSDKLYVNDTSKTAVFTGNVIAVQGDSTLRAPELHVSYEGKAADQLVGATPQGGEASRLSRLVAVKGSDVTIGTDRRVTSDQADFDAKADTALFTGDVVVTQQRNILRGQRLFVDRKTGQSRLETPSEGRQPGRITARFYQTENKATPQAKPKSAITAAQEGVLGSFKSDPNAPIDVEADTLDIYDQSKEAVFRGNVKSQQGDLLVRTVEMTATYTGQAGFGLTSSNNDAGGKGASQLTRIEARRKVLITSKDGQTATGDWADFDVKANTVLMGDRVIVSRGKDVAEGPRLKIDLTTGMYRFELESAAATPGAAPSISASPPISPPQPSQPATTDPAARSCPPGKQCLLFYPKEAQQKAKDAVQRKAGEGKARPGGPDDNEPGEAGQPATSASPAQRGN